MKSVFISSTFKDMQAERDYLHERIFPRIQRELRASGETIQELDLRWGVDTSDMTEEESGKQVLKVCIDAIDRCKPYTIVLLGERYGWIPGLSVVKEANDARVNEHYQENMSITNLEIRYAALDDEELCRRCIFCFRDPSFLADMDSEERRIYDAESPMHRERLNRLKEEIRRLPDAKIVEYEVVWDPGKGQPDGMETFGEQVFALLSAMIREELAGTKLRTPEEQAAVETAYRMERYLSSYIQRGREEYALLHQSVQYQMNQNDYGGKRWKDTCLCGEAGSGKSALMASCANRLRENGERVILYFCGAPGCQDPNMLKRMMVWQLEQILGAEAEGIQGRYEERLGELNSRLGTRQVYCFIDGIDQMFSQGSGLCLDVLGKCTQVYFILSAVPEFPVEALFQTSGRSVSRVTLGGLETFQMRRLIEATTRRRGKKLDDGLVGELLEKKGAKNPLYLSLILQRFFMMDGNEFRRAEELAPGMEGLHRYMSELLAGLPERADELIKTILLITGERFGEGEFERILALLAVSKGGLTEQELEKIFAIAGRTFSQLRFQQIVSYLYDAFQLLANGKWEFTHRLFREALLRQPGIAEARQLLIRLALCDEDFLRQEGFAYILDARLPEGAMVLEKAAEFAKPGKVCDYVAELIRQGETAYFEEMAAGGFTEALADFWIHVFPGTEYGNICEALQNRICRSLLDGGCCFARQTAELGIRLAENALKASDFPGVESYCRQGEAAALQISEPEQSLLLARLIFCKAQSAGLQRRGDDLALYERAAALAVAAAEDSLEEEAVYWRVRIRCAWISETCWQKKEILTRESEKDSLFLELHRNQVSEEVCSESLLRLIRCRIELLLAEELPKEAKRKQVEEFAKSGMELADEYPSVQNLTLIYGILEELGKLTDTKAQHQVIRTQIHYARRRAERRGTREDRYDLMYALFLYAYRADSVLMDSPSIQTSDEIGNSSVESWEEGFALLEQLLEENESDAALRLDAANLYVRYSNCRIELDFDEAKYPVMRKRAEHAIRLYEEAGKPEDSYSWMNCIRDAHLDMGTLCRKLHETSEALMHLTEAEKTGWRMCERKPNARNLLRYLDILKWHMAALYQERKDDLALEAAGKLEQLLTDWQVTGGEDYLIQLYYVRGRIAYEKGDLTTADLMVRQLEPYRELLKKKILGDQCLILALDVACSKSDLPAAKSAWSAAEEHLKDFYKNNWMREHAPSMAAEVRYYLEYGYERIINLWAAAGTPVPLSEQKAWHEALDAPLKNRITIHEEKTTAKRQAQMSPKERQREAEKEEWRLSWQENWANLSAAMDQADTDQLLTLPALYQKLAEEDSRHDVLAYRLREERQKLAKELYRRTGDPKHIADYLDEADRHIAGFMQGGPRFKDTGIPVYEWGEDIERCAVELLSGLYEETGEQDWLMRMISYLEHALKRYNLSRIAWYLEIFSYLETHIADDREKERLQELRQRRYGWELERMMLTYRISRKQ